MAMLPSSDYEKTETQAHELAKQLNCGRRNSGLHRCLWKAHGGQSWTVSDAGAGSIFIFFTDGALWVRTFEQF